MLRAMTTRHASTLAIGAAGALLVMAYATLAAVQILVLNPLAAVPGKSLGRIHADMAAMNESPGSAMTLTILGAGVALALVVLLLLTVRSDSTPTAAVVAYLTMLAFGAPAYFIASFGPGMSLADTYGIGGADYSRWALPLYAISLLSVVALVAVAVARMTVRSPQTVTPA
jgi:hypothetical protein